DVGPATPAHLDVESGIVSHDSGAEEAGGPGLADRARDPLRGQRVFAADVDVPALAPGPDPRDRHRLPDRVRIGLHEDPILEGTRLRLVGIAYEVMGPRLRLRHRFPLSSRGKGGAAAAEELRGDDLPQDPLRADGEGALQRFEAAV